MRLTVAAFGLVAALVVSGCGGDDSGSPVAPSAPIPQFAGTWAGALNVTSRTATDGVRELNPDLDCDSLADCGNWFPVSAEFTQSGRAVSGTVSTTFNEPPQFEWESQTGTIDGAGTLRMTFQAARSSAFRSVSTPISSFEARRAWRSS